MAYIYNGIISLDINTFIVNNLDNSIKLNFDLIDSETNTSTTIRTTQTQNRIISLPDISDQLIGRNTIDVLSNKTINSSNIIDDGALSSNVVFEITTQTLSNKTINSSNTIDDGALSSNVVFEITTQTLSNKTINSSNTIDDGALSSNVVFEIITQTLSNKTINSSNTIDDGALSSNVVFETTTQTLSNKTMNTSNNTFVLDTSDITSGQLSVSRGGTGIGSHTSGNVLIGEGTNAISSSKSAPSGDFVGTNDTQTISNKTIDSSNTINSGSLPDDVVFEEGVQTISDKIIDSSNIINDDALSSNVVFETTTQTLTNKTIDGTNTINDGALTDNVVKRDGNTLVNDSLGMTGGSDSFNQINLKATSTTGDMFLRFESAGTGSQGHAKAGIMFTRSFVSQFNMSTNYINSSLGERFMLRYKDSTPTTQNDLGITLFSIETHDQFIRFHNPANNSPAIFDTSSITGNRLLTIPDDSGTFLLEDNSATISNKTIDSSNDVADGALSSNVIRRAGGTWNRTTFGWSDTEDTYQSIVLVSTSGAHTFFRFRTGGAPTGFSGITLSTGNSAFYNMFSTGNHFEIRHTSSLPTSVSTFGDRRFTINAGNNIRFHNTNNDSHGVEWDVSDTTAMRTLTAPDASGTILLEDNSTTVSNKTIDDSNAINDDALSDNVFRRDGDTWVSDTFATGESGDLKYLNVESTGGVNRFLRFNPGTGAVFRSNNHYFHMVPISNNLRIYYRNDASTTAGDYGLPMFGLIRQTNPSDQILDIYNQNGSIIRLYPNDITSDRNIRFPDESGTLALHSQIQNIESDKVAGEALEPGDIVYIATDGKWYKADASGATTSNSIIGYANETKALDEAIDVILRGIITDGTWSWTIGGSLYLSTTEGTLSQTAPTGTDDVVATLGWAISADKIYFNPDNNRIVIADDPLYEFDASNLSTLRTFTLPDTSGTILLEDNSTTVSNKTIDSSNDVDNGALSDLVVKRNPSFPDEWDVFSLGMPSGTNVFRELILQGDTSTDRFFRFRTRGSAPNGHAGVMFSRFNNNNALMYMGLDNVFRITTKTSVPTEYDDLGTTVLSIPISSGHIRMHDGVDDTKIAEVDVSGISTGTTRTLAAPNASGTLLLEDNTTTISNKTIDSSNDVADGALSDNVVKRDGNSWNQTSLGMSGGYSDMTLFAGSSENKFFRFLTTATPESEAGILFSAYASRNWPIFSNWSAFRINFASTLPTEYGQLGNTVFSIESDNKRVRFHDYTDDTKIGEFDMSGITSGTTRTLTTPNASGTILLEGNSTTVSNKTIDGTNTINDGALSNNVVKRIGGTWSTSTLGMTSGGYDDILLSGGSSDDRFFRFRTGGGSPNGRRGIMLSAFDSSNWSLFGDQDSNFKINFTSTLPTGYNELGNTVFSITNNNKRIRFHDFTDDTKIAEFDVSGITTGTTRTLTAPNDDIIIAGRISGSSDWSRNALGLHGDGYSDIRVATGTSADRFFRFRSGGTAPNNGRSGVALTMGESENYHLFTDPDAFQITATNTNTPPTAYDELGNTVLSIDNTNKRIRFHDFTDDTKIAEVNVSGITTGTTRTLAAPNASGTLLLEDNSTTVSNKTIDDSNTINDGALSNNVVRRVSDRWVYETLAMGESGNLGTYKRMRLDAVGDNGSGGIDRFFNFRSVGPNSPGHAGIHFSRFDTSNYFMGCDPDGVLQITYKGSLPTTDNDLGKALFSIDNSNGRIRFHDFIGVNKIVEFDIAQINNNVTRTLTFPNTSMSFVGVNSGSVWNTTSLGMSGGFDTITLNTNTNQDRCFRFRSTGNPRGASGIMLSDTDNRNYSLFSRDNALWFTYTETLPSDFDQLGSAVFSIGRTDGVRIHDMSDDSKIAKFNLSGISTETTQTYAFPDDSGTLLLEGNSTTVSNKTIDNSNTINDGALSNNVVKRSGSIWDVTSLGLGGGYSDIRLHPEPNEDRFFRFRTGGPPPRGRNGIMLSSFDDSNYLIYASNHFHINFASTVPTDYDQLGDTVFSIDNTNKRVRFHDFTDDSKIGQFDVSGISTSTTQTYALPDASGTLLLEDNSTTVSNKTIDSSNDVADGALSDNVVKRSSNNWDTTSLGMSSTETNLTQISLNGSLNPDISRYFTFNSSGANGFPDKGLAGIIFTGVDGDGEFISPDNWRYVMYAAGASWRLSRMTTSGAAPSMPHLDGTVISVRMGTESGIRIHKNNEGDNVYARLNTFDLSAPRVFTFPDTSGTLLLEDNSTTVSNKTIDSSNDVADGALSNNVIRRNGNSIIKSSLGFSNEGSGGYNDIRINGQWGGDIFLNFRGRSTGNDSACGVAFTEGDDRAYFLNCEELSGEFVISTRSGIPTTINDRGSIVFSIDGETNGRIRLHDSTDDTKIGEFDVSGISTGTTRTFTLPDTSMTLIGQTDGELDLESLNIGGTEEYDEVKMITPTGRDRFLRFVSSSLSNPQGSSGVVFSTEDDAHWRIFSNYQQTLNITKSTNIPTSNASLGDTVIQLHQNGNIWLFDTTSGGNGGTASLDLSNINGVRTYSFPDTSGTIALAGNIPGTMHKAFITGTRSFPDNTNEGTTTIGGLNATYMKITIWGGGGGGGYSLGGGGGGSGGAVVGWPLEEDILDTLSGTTFSVNIGNGGWSVSGDAGGPGANTTIISQDSNNMVSLTAYGGGGGGGYDSGFDGGEGAGTGGPGNYWTDGNNIANGIGGAAGPPAGKDDSGGDISYPWLTGWGGGTGGSDGSNFFGRYPGGAGNGSNISGGAGGYNGPGGSHNSVHAAANSGAGGARTGTGGSGGAFIVWWT
jgi:hypothetical protein